MGVISPFLSNRPGRNQDFESGWQEEATGAYHHQLEQALADPPRVKLNPAQALRFAQAAGPLAKTDRIDALWAAVGALIPPSLPQDARTSSGLPGDGPD